MKKTIIKLVVGFILFGAALGLSFKLGDNLLDPIKEVMSYGGSYVRYTIIEVIGNRILQTVGIFFIWVIAYVMHKIIVKDITS